MAEAVEDVVHPHDGRGGLRGVDVGLIEVRGRLFQDGSQQLRIAARDGAGNRCAPRMLRRQFGLSQDSAQVELEVLGKFRNRIEQLIEWHEKKRGAWTAPRD